VQLRIYSKPLNCALQMSDFYGAGIIL
jgi:hypothetical protein